MPEADPRSRGMLRSALMGRKPMKGGRLQAMGYGQHHSYRLAPLRFNGAGLARLLGTLPALAVERDATSFGGFSGAGLGASLVSAGFVSGGLAVASTPEDSLESLSGCSARLRLPSLSDLKSVSYHPPPFSRKTGAEISRLSCCLPQVGHLRNGASEIFCRTSTWALQALHWYS